MKTLGVCLIVLSMVIGFISDKCINPISVEPFIGLAFCFFLIGIYILIKTINCRFMRGVPNPPEHLRPKKKCICNDIGKHYPGGRCEADHSEVKCYKNCGNTKPFPRGNGSICLNCGSSIVKDGGSDLSSFSGRPEFPKDRT